MIPCVKFTISLSATAFRRSFNPNTAIARRRRLTPAEYQTELKAKLVEEAREVQEASDREAFIEELADLSEVLDAIMDFFEIDATEIQAVKDAKAQTRGRFKDRIFLEFTEDEDEPSA